MSEPATARRSPRRSPRAATADPVTRRRVIDAAVACILERGFYRASSNEIARRAGVTWGVIQHHFGTREALMLAVLEDGASRFVELVEDAEIEPGTAEERIEQLIEILMAHYGTPEYLAYVQVLLNMDHDPDTSVEVRRTMRSVAERANDHLRRLLREALGPAQHEPDLATTLFLTLRGFALSHQLLDTMAYDSVPSEDDGAARHRHLLAEMLARYVDRTGP